VDDDAGVATSGGGQCALGAAKIAAESRLWLVVGEDRGGEHVHSLLCREPRGRRTQLLTAKSRQFWLFFGFVW